MPRQRMAPGEHGRITESVSGGKYFATTYVRDSDGRRRRVERSSDKSAEDARRILQRHLSARRAPLDSQQVNDKTTLSELFERWIEAKVKRGEIKPQTENQYRRVWAKHGEKQLGALRILELDTPRADTHIQAVAAATPAQAAYLRLVLREMYALAVRFGVLAINPIAGTETAKRNRKPVRAVSAEEFAAVRSAVAAYTGSRDGKGGPRPGRLLPAFVEVLAATGARPGEILALRWSDVDLLADPPTVTISGTLLDHGAAGPLHRQEARKHDAPAHTVTLPRFGVEALTELIGESGMEGPVFATRDGGWVSLANLRRCLREALPEELSWVTPHSFRRTVGTVVRRELGPAAAQQQLSHAELSTTERHYVQRQTVGPDVRAALDKFAGQESGDRK
ncbi:tyrosine-type recombinase/integrase [Mycolicibacterium austroafricanum]|uniref:Tyrosine-type recombinase/integrase n=1 Tax=Mycolicibacterium austroafricanum TaxID=39687 RepID=A0ABT8HIZ6_MYCAO|nr:tyrosine-type recombinase/integrase [Mycolicibacterium austroafricanum]MDN4520721.1 tyrosine-type recombinase/integrase [Mycolicibacterium austroafricanum]